MVSVPVDKNNSEMNGIVGGSADQLGSTIVNGLRRSSRFNTNYVSFNLSIRKATSQYGIRAEEAIKKEVQQMLDK